ncbi:MAG: hypothetical protein CL912_09885 [Deltaproteobacteria bacterium]|nr:hypothetical protein [Deltaproteobacteria bacterium]
MAEPHIIATTLNFEDPLVGHKISNPSFVWHACFRILSDVAQHETSKKGSPYRGSFSLSRRLRHTIGYREQYEIPGRLAAVAA